MKNTILLVLSSLIFVACNQISGSGNVISEKREVPEFHSIHVSGAIDVEIISADHYDLSAEDDDNLLPYLITEVNNGVLNIHYKNDINTENDHGKVYVSGPSFEKITTSGSGDIKGKGIIRNTDQLEFDLSGSGDVEAEIDAPSIKVGGSGSGNVELSGRTKNFDCNISGSGDVKCKELQSENTTITISGSGNAEVFASVKLIARTSGSGDIRYWGNPATNEIHSSGSGSIEKQN